MFVLLIAFASSMQGCFLVWWVFSSWDNRLSKTVCLRHFAWSVFDINHFVLTLAFQWKCFSLWNWCFGFCGTVWYGYGSPDVSMSWGVITQISILPNCFLFGEEAGYPNLDCKQLYPGYPKAFQAHCHHIAFLDGCHSWLLNITRQETLHWKHLLAEYFN